MQQLCFKGQLRPKSGVSDGLASASGAADPKAHWAGGDGTSEGRARAVAVWMSGRWVSGVLRLGERGTQELGDRA